MKIAVASGKGGTGKTTVALNLAVMLAECSQSVCLLDCDVEEPNCHLFFDATPQENIPVYSAVPQVDPDKCINCGQCSNICQFNAIAASSKKVLIFEELCHSCGGCVLVCPVAAMKEVPKEIGRINTYKLSGFDFISGFMQVGNAISPPLIHEVKDRSKNYENVLTDCPPGTTCPVVASVEGADYVILVTEPGLFGLHDLELSVELLRTMNLPFGVVINRSCENDYIIENYLKRESIELLTKIPEDIRIAQAYSKGIIPVKAFEDYKKYIQPLLKHCKLEV